MANEADLKRLVEMGSRFIRESEYREFIDDNPAALEALMLRLLKSKDAVIYVIDHDYICGMIGMHVYLHPMSLRMTGAEAFWWVEPEHRGRDGLRLLDYGEAWVKSTGARCVQMIAPNEKVARLYVARGYRKFEEQYQRDFQ